jgi:hypothetical protein
MALFAGIYGGQAGGQMNLLYFPEAKDESTKIVFIQVMRELLDGVPVFPSKLDATPRSNFLDTDTTPRFYHVDYVQGMVNPWAADLAPGHVSGSAFGPHPYAPGTPAKFWDDPEFHDIVVDLLGNVRAGPWHMKWEFRTAAFSAAGADAGTYYAYQDWSYEVWDTGAWKSLRGPTGIDPGPDFKDAVSFWAGNHAPFKVPTPPPPQPPPAWKGAIPYRAQSGDTLQSIALKFYGQTYFWATIYNVNQGVVYGDHLNPIEGQVLVIP